MKKKMLRLSDLEKAQLDKLREMLMDKGLDIVKRVGLDIEDFSYGAIVKLCADALMKYVNENKIEKGEK